MRANLLTSQKNVLVVAVIDTARIETFLVLIKNTKERELTDKTAAP